MPDTIFFFRLLLFYLLDFCFSEMLFAASFFNQVSLTLSLRCPAIIAVRKMPRIVHMTSIVSGCPKSVFLSQTCFYKTAASYKCENKSVKCRGVINRTKLVVIRQNNILGHPISSCRLLCIHFMCRFINIRR